MKFEVTQKEEKIVHMHFTIINHCCFSLSLAAQSHFNCKTIIYLGAVCFIATGFLTAIRVTCKL